MALTKVRGDGAEGLTLSSTALTVANGLTLTDGNVTLASGHGIDFSATSDGTTMSSELLDDYEEGTFTATCNNSVTLHSDKDLLTYTKVGRVVTVGGQIRVNNGQGGAELIINNLPFTVLSAGEDSGYYMGAVRLFNYNIANSALFVAATASQGSTTLLFEQSLDDASSATLGADDDGFIMFSVTYLAA
jgi:hypothetical protein